MNLYLISRVQAVRKMSGEDQATFKKWMKLNMLVMGAVFIILGGMSFLR